ncbi:MAG: hypothetical protein MUC50_06670 [Myxococcota bacterium]|nr:hypothetical protein [Myxococcota bacterium]
MASRRELAVHTGVVGSKGLGISFFRVGLNLAALTTGIEQRLGVCFVEAREASHGLPDVYAELTVGSDELFGLG